MSKNSEYDSSVTDMIINQLLKDSEDLTNSLEAFISERGKAIHSQKLALAAYDDEIAAILDNDSDDNYLIQTEEAKVDHNVMRHLNANKELNATEIVADEENEVAVDEKIIVSLTNKRKKKKNILKPEPKVLDMEEKRNVREQMFRLLDESRIEEMRLELEIENAKENNDLEREKNLTEELFELQIRNSQNLTEMISDYNPVSVAKNWGNDEDYVKMLKHLATIAQTPANLTARTSIGEMHHVNRINQKS